ncbi:MAG TPA: pilus assembly protein PilB, partial [Burkholderiaceae bacterium]|nr:pilus assembly protein PilB [Burkholderiaceae bacterium]
MTDLSSPTLLTLLTPDTPEADARADDAPAGWRWPTPALPAFAPAQPYTQPLPCEIQGLNGKIMSGRLILFVPEQQVVHVQVPPARTTVPLRFNQFRKLTL